MNTLAAVMETVNLPEASFNGLKQKKSDWHKRLSERFVDLLPVLQKKFSEQADSNKLQI